ncbi:MAG: nucleotidyltransferase domain-containing protein [Candidatus Cloacimonetes bacterium]|nr:nucleotidyltransferase domain-containing protein [Candidatus Cloacimonadota bacterium]
MEIQERLLNKIIKLARQYGVTRLILFGSMLDDPSIAQDIDLACDGLTGWNFYKFGAKLEEELNLSVDLIPLTPTTLFTKYIESKGKSIL